MRTLPPTLVIRHRRILAIADLAAPAKVVLDSAQVELRAEVRKRAGEPRKLRVTWRRTDRVTPPSPSGITRSV